jgi:N-acetyl-anhydromuramoyl-L-alanine amidase
MGEPSSGVAGPDAGVDAAGWVSGIERCPSPHCDPRPEGMPIELLVVHNISLPPGQFSGDAIADLFLGRLDCDAHPYYERLRGVRVSAHFLVRRDGHAIQFVPCTQRAWHAGESRWRDRTRCNDFSIGIELEGTDETPFTDAQYTTLNSLAERLCAAYPIAAITGHSDIAPGRKTDPGPWFDWARLAAKGPGAGDLSRH